MNRTIRELAIEYHEKKEADRTIVYGVVNRGKLKEITQQMTEQGLSAMGPFIDWYIRKRGVEPDYAERIAMYAWTVLWETENDYMSRLMDPHLSRTAYSRIIKSLKMLSVYFTTSHGRTQKEREFGSQITNNLMTLKSRIKSLNERKEKPVVPPKPRRAITKIPYSEEQIDSLLEEIEVEYKKTGRRYPWYKVILRIVVLTGVDSVDLMHVSRKEITRVYEEHRSGMITGIPLWRKGKRVKVVPASLMSDELTTLMHWPMEYGTLGDLVSPMAKASRRSGAGSKRIGRHLNKAARTVLKTDKLPHNFMMRVRYSAMRRVFLAVKKDWITMAQIYGTEMRNLQSYEFLKEL